jgi:hypothetical protein
VEDVKQHRFPWAAAGQSGVVDEVVLDPATTATAITLLARIVRAVVRASQEANDER